MVDPDWDLAADERETLGAALDALLPPEGSFPRPSATGIVDDFILQRIPPAGEGPVPYPGIDAADLKEILARLTSSDDMTAALEWLERERPSDFQALWALAVYGYYSRPETVAAIQADLTTGYHGAPLPLGYADVIAPWNADDPLQMPRNAPERFIKTDDVRPIDVSGLDFVEAEG